MPRLGRIGTVLRHPIVAPRFVAQRVRLWRVLYGQRRNGGILSVNIRRKSGFFAHLSWCAYVMGYCHDRSLIPHVTSENPLYVDPERGPDFLAYFFDNPEQARIDANVVRSVTIAGIGDLGLPTSCIAAMTPERASMLFRRYLRVRPEILEEVDRFCADHFDGGRVLGVHFRGTDKTREAPRVSPEECSAAIRRFLEQHPDVARIFVTSDEAWFIPFVQAEFPELAVSFRDDQRSDGTRPVHRLEFTGGNYEKGRQALLSCLLLSRCDAVIRTASTLSAWASVFNPRLPVIMLNRPHPHTLWFPDRCLVQTATMAGPS